MKCDHIRTREQGDTPFYPNMLNNGNVEICLKEDVDAAIAELKSKIQLDEDEMAGFLQLEEECGGGDFLNYIAELKQKLHDTEIQLKVAREDCILYQEQIERDEAKNKRLKRALYKACANWAKVTRNWDEGKPADDYDKWYKMERKCLKKAEEYK